MRISNFKVALVFAVITGFLGASSLYSAAYSLTDSPQQEVALQSSEEDSTEDESSNGGFIALAIFIIAFIVFIAAFPFSEDQRPPRESKRVRESREATQRAISEQRAEALAAKYKDEEGNWLPNDHEVWQKNRRPRN